ncbi:MAG: hypothetical protein JXX28_14520 [Deltaproteobacteria bacterium]|nr:hypothetical protein [Deltaproteobacteria bacterium]
MLASRFTWILALSLTAPALAFADDLLEDDDDALQETEEEKKAREAAERARLTEADSVQDLLDDGDEIKALDDVLDEEDQIDLLGGDGASAPGAKAGQDTAELYRAQQADVADADVDEELMAWDRYLERYPQTLFRDRIEKRIEELNDLAYGRRIDRGGPQLLDANQRDVPIAQGMTLDSLNPTDRMQAGFEWGLPSYMNLFVDYESALKRDLSVHGGARHRYTGWSFEGGVRYALIKSSRTQSIVTFLGDVHFNSNPAFLGIRPQIGVGKKFGQLDLQGQFGVDIDTRPLSAPKVIGGLNGTYYAADNIAGFLETSVYMGNLGWDEGPFRFNLAAFGLKFFPELANEDAGKLEVNVAASVPYTSNYWRYHFGSIMTQINYYM